MHLSNPYASALFAASLAVGMVVCLAYGRRLGRTRSAAGADTARDGLGALEAAVFGLFGLLIAFTFSGASQRFDERRALVVSEANAIGTAWMRLDLLPPVQRDALRELFRVYLDSRLEVYSALPDRTAAQGVLERSGHIQGDIWSAAVAACRGLDGPWPAQLVLPPINEMIDLTTTRTMELLHHPPGLIYGFLFLLGLWASLMAGHAMSSVLRPSWAHVIGFALLMALAVLLTLDIEYPRSGWIQVDGADQALRDLRASMG